jgi:hypothetical protein
MTMSAQMRGGAPVGFLTELEAIEAASIIYLRLWCGGTDQQVEVIDDLTASLGEAYGHKAGRSFEDLCRLCAQHGRRPLMRHSVQCKCIGADEACFANLIAAAATGDREDAMMIAMLIVRPDFAPLLTYLAADFGLALKRMNLCSLRAGPNSQAHHSPNSTLH